MPFFRIKRPVLAILAMALILVAGTPLTSHAADVFVKKKTTAQQLRDDKALREAREKAFDAQGGLPVVPGVNGVTPVAPITPQIQGGVSAQTGETKCSQQNLQTLDQYNTMLGRMQQLQSMPSASWTQQDTQLAQYVNNPGVMMNMQNLYSLCIYDFIRLKKAEAVQNAILKMPSTPTTPGINSMTPDNVYKR